jgi:hypothetical protein
VTERATQAVYRPVEDVVQRNIGGEVFLVPVRGHLADLQDLFVLNEVGSWLWERFVSGAIAEDLTQAVVAEFEVTEEQARADVRIFLAHLLEAGLIEEVSPPKL